MTFRSTFPYLIALVLPGLTTAFLLVPAGRPWVAGAWVLSLLGIAIADEILPRVTQPRAPDAVEPETYLQHCWCSNTGDGCFADDTCCSKKCVGASGMTPGSCG